MRKAMLRVVLSVALFALTLQAFGQSYPTRPIRMIIPYPPGGGSTNIGRLLAQKVSESIGQQLVVDNRGGANGTIGMELAAQAPSDGYTIVFALTAQLAINPSYYPELRYDSVRDYAPITLLGTAPYVLVAHPSVPAKSVKEMLALAKSRPGKLTYASSGTGGIPHLAFEMLKSMGGIDIPHVPYKGGGAALPDLLGGRVQFLISTVSPVLPHLRQGERRQSQLTQFVTAVQSHGLADLTRSAAGWPSASPHQSCAYIGLPATGNCALRITPCSASVMSSVLPSG